MWSRVSSLAGKGQPSPAESVHRFDSLFLHSSDSFDCHPAFQPAPLAEKTMIDGGIRETLEQAVPLGLRAALESPVFDRDCRSLFATLDNRGRQFLVPEQLVGFFKAVSGLKHYSKRRSLESCMKICQIIGGPSMRIEEDTFGLLVLAASTFSTLGRMLSMYGEDDLIDEEVAECIVNALEGMVSQAQDVEGVKTDVPPPPVKKSQLLYLDILKLFLTAVVIQHHVFCCFAVVPTGGGWFIEFGNYTNLFGTVTTFVSGINQAYFMSMFFFISAYFTPGSYDRKGKLAFLKDKVKRLGYPVICWYFVAGPLLMAFLDVAIPTGPSVHPYRPVSGPPWFILWLLVFNWLYAVAPLPELPNVRFSYTVAFAASTCVGALQGVIQVYLPPGRELGHINVGYMPLYVLYFSAGIVARRGKWLDGLRRPGLRGLALLGLLAFAIVAGLCTAAADEVYGAQTPTGSVMVCALLGLLCADLILFVLMFSERFLNFKTRLIQEMVLASYSVYLLHTWIVVILAVSFAWILQANGAPVPFERTNSGGWANFTPLAKEWYLAAGCAYVGVLAQLVSWPLGAIFRRLPLIRSIL